MHQNQSTRIPTLWARANDASANWMAGIVPLLLLIFSLVFPAHAQQSQLPIRKNWIDLSPQQKAAFKNGVKVMMSRPDNDPTSWAYQVNLAGTNQQEALAAWNTGQTGNWHFLSWNRMHLHYFERILRKASGDPTLNLPYWDSSGSASLPKEFREPADPRRNALYNSERCPDINLGGPIPAGLGNPVHAINQPVFVSQTGSRLAFGGGKGEAGALEVLNDRVQDYVGGPEGGYLSNPKTAAKDPIYWLHRANMDRLWAHWNKASPEHLNPSDPGWLNAEFTFFDESRNRVTGKVAEFS